MNIKLNFTNLVLQKDSWYKYSTRDLKLVNISLRCATFTSSVVIEIQAK